MNNILNVTNSETYKLYNELLSYEFVAELRQMFDYEYHRDKAHLSIFIEIDTFRFNELYGLCRQYSCTIEIVKHAGDKEVKLLVRKPAQHGEFITNDVWRQYSNPPPFM